MITWVFVAVLGLFLAGIGLITGFMLADTTYLRAGAAIGHFIRRVLSKAFIRTVNDSERQVLAKQDSSFSRLNGSERRQHADPHALEAAEQFKTILTQIYGPKLSGVYIFGSRARGDYTIWSDLDVLLIFEQTMPLLQIRTEVSWAAFQVLLKHGLLIQPRLVESEAMNSINDDIHPVIRRALQTGILV